MAGTSADFYVQEPDGSVNWLGSMEFDGYPYSSEIEPVVATTTRTEYMQAVVSLSERISDFTRPEQGYPFGRKSSAETPYTYVFLNEGYVAVYKRGRPAKDSFPKLKFPDLTPLHQPHVKVQSNGKAAVVDAIRAASVEEEE